VPTVRRLDADDDVVFAAGLGGLDSFAFGTIAFFFRPLAAYDSTNRTLLAAYDSTGVAVGKISVGTNNKVLWWSGGSGGSGPTFTAGDWHLLVIRKPAGTEKVRFSMLNLVGWTHVVTDLAIADWVAPTGGTWHTFDPVFGWGPGSDLAAMAVWANELPWAADTFGDAEIEAAGLEDHLDNWRDAAPTAGWAFDQADVNINIEDFTLDRADEISVAVGAAVDATDLDFQYEDAGPLALSRNFLRTTQTEPGTGGIVRDLSETQGTPTTLGSGSTSSGSFTKMLEWVRTVGTAVGSATISTQFQVTAVSAATLAYKWQVHRYNSAGVLQADSDFSAEHNTTGIKVATLTLSTTWSAGDRLGYSLWLRKAGGGGSRDITVAVNDADSWAEFEVTPPPPIEVTPATVTVTATSGALTVTTGSVDITPAAETVSASPGTLTVANAAATGLISGTVSANPATLSCAVGERLICIAFSRGGGTAFGVTPDAGGGTWTNRVVEATLPGNDLARRSLGVAELVPTSTVTDGLFTAAWSADPTDAIWLRVEEGGAFGFADAATADSDTGSVTSLATGDTASIPAGDLLLVAAAAIRDGGAAGTGWAAAAINPALVAGGNLLLDAYAGKGAGGNAGVGGYLILDGQGAGVRADTLTLPGGDAAKQISVALVVWSTGVAGALDITPDAVTVTATPGALTITSTAAITPAPVTTTATPGTLALTATAAITPAAVTVTTTPGTVEVAAESGAQPVTPAAVTVTCSAGALTVTTGAVGITPDPVTVTATPGAAAITQGLTVALTGAAVSIVPAGLVVTTGAVSIVPGGITVTAVAGSLSLAVDVTPEPVAVSVTTGSVAIALDIPLTGAGVSVTPGMASVGHGLLMWPDAVTVTATAGMATISIGAGVLAPPVSARRTSVAAVTARRTSATTVTGG
jgi:hypothetical protein